MPNDNLNSGSQYAVEPEPTKTQGKPVEAATESLANTEDTKTYTAKEVDKLLAEKVASVTQSVETKLSEAQKLAKMSADEQENYKAEQREKILAERENEITKRELIATAKDALSSKEMPLELVSLLDYSNAESCTKSIETLEKAFKSAVAKGVNDAIKGTTPKAPTSSNDSSTTLRAVMGLQ